MNVLNSVPSASKSLPAEPLIEFQQVEKVYELGNQRIRALRGINFSIQEGAFLAVAGPSGSGKSTFLNLASLIDTPTQGTIRYKGLDVKALGDNEITRFRNKKIGIVFQSYNLIPVLSALENVALPLQINKEPKSECFDRAEALLKEVGLGEHLKHRPGNLSGGQRQRVAIARALVTQPKIVIADEPTAALDTKTAFEIIRLMKSLNESLRTTFLFSTHDTRILQEVNTVIQIQDGCIVPNLASDKVAV